MRGRVIRSSYEDGKTAFIFNEAPRAVITDVKQKIIGEPIPLIRAFDQQKYDDIPNKYHSNYFKIPYLQKFREIMLDGKYLPKTSKQLTLELRDRVSRRQSGAPQALYLLGFGTELALKILSFAYKYHKVKILLKRLNVTGFLTATSPSFGSLGIIPKKCVDLPIFSNNSIVVRGAGESNASEDCDFDKFYKVNEKINVLEGEFHQDIIGLRSLYAIKNLNSLKKLEMLIMPYAFNPINNEQNQAAQILELLKSDRLKAFSFEVKIENELLVEVFQTLKEMKNLTDLQLNISTKDNFIALLNQSLNRESNIKHININFLADPNSEK